MQRASVRLYYVAVVSNVLALGIPLCGLMRPLQRPEQVVAVMLTAISAAGFGVTGSRTIEITIGSGHRFSCQG
jgi:hypothetical protein